MICTGRMRRRCGCGTGWPGWSGQVPVLMVGAMRPGHGREELAALSRQVAGLAAGGRGVVVELGALTAAAVTELVAGLVGGGRGGGWRGWRRRRRGTRFT